MKKIYKNICKRKGCGHLNYAFDKRRKGENCGGCGLPLLLKGKK